MNDMKNKPIYYLPPFLSHLKTVEYVHQAQENKPVVLLHKSQQNEHEYPHQLPRQFLLQLRNKSLPTRNPSGYNDNCPLPFPSTVEKDSLERPL